MNSFTNTSSYVAYAGLLVSLLAMFGVTLLPMQAEAIVGGIVTLIAVIWGHYNHTAVVAAARLGGVSA